MVARQFRAQSRRPCDPASHFRLAIDAGLNAYASLLGFLEAGAAAICWRNCIDSQTERPICCTRKRSPLVR